MSTLLTLSDSFKSEKGTTMYLVQIVAIIVAIFLVEEVEVSR